MFKAIIVEDEQPILELMKVIVGRSAHYEIAGAFTSPIEALDRFPELRPDIAFIDIEMPRMNGIELAKKFREHSADTEIVFTTAYKEYALEAFDVQALDYILKPVVPAAIERVTERLNGKRGAQARGKAGQSAPASADIRCFGGFEVRDPEGELLRFPTRKSEEMLAYFLCNPGRIIGKWELADLLWPDLEEERASRNIYNTVYLLKKKFREHRIGLDIQKLNEGYMLEIGGCVYDVFLFEQHTGEARNKLPVQKEQAEMLCSLYKGPLLRGKPYLWKLSLEERYANEYSALLRSLIHTDVQANNWSQAAYRLEQYIANFPLHEEMNGLLLDVYARSGHKEKLVKCCEKLRAAYRQELGMELPRSLQAKAAAYLAEMDAH